MTKVELMNSVSRTFHKVGFALKKHSPEILVVAGVVGGVTSAVMACKATTKVSAILEDTKKDIEGIHSVLEDPELGDRYKKEYGEEYTEEASKKDLAIVYAQTGLKFVKLYGPSVVLGAASIACILGSNSIMRKRNAGLAAAYAAVDLGFKDYRNRVVERFGKDLDRELRYNLQAKEVEETVTNEDGTETTVKRTIQVVDPNLRHCEYTRCFDETCENYQPNADDNLFFLLQVQNWANEKLKAKGHLYLNEVLEMLGMQKTRSGQIVGWVYDENNPDCDCFIDFHIFDIHNPDKRAFVNGYEKSIWLDFNVDGVVYDLLA
jgi:hypothetical protein